MTIFRCRLVLWGGRGRPFKSGHSDQNQHAVSKIFRNCVFFCVRKNSSTTLSTTISVQKTGDTAGDFLFCTAGFLCIIRLYCPLNFQKIIPRHIPRDILPRRLFTAGSRRSSNTIPSQLTRHAVVDVVRSGGQP